MREPVAVIAESLRLAREAARRLAADADARLPGPPRPFTPESYLRTDAAPSRIVLCVSGGASAAAAFVEGCAARLLWPPPHAEMHRAIDGIRAEVAAPRRVRSAHARPPRGASARLLEGRVDRRRAEAALAAGPPFEWIVESPRHVRLAERVLGELAARGVTWSALDPVELVAVAGPATLAPFRREWGKHLPRGVPFLGW